MLLSTKCCLVKCLLKCVVDYCSPLFLHPLRIITEKEKECTYLTSPTITRFTPPVNKVSGRGQGNGSPRDSFRNGLSTNQTSDVVLIVEPGPVIKGLEPIEITCKGTSHMYSILVCFGGKKIIRFGGFT